MSWGAVSRDESLIVYQRALQFVMTLYGLCAVFPASEKDHLTRLLKNAAVAVTTHISEGGKKALPFDKIRSLNTALGYLEECEFYMKLAEQQGYIDASAEKSELKLVSNVLKEHIESLSDS